MNEHDFRQADKDMSKRVDKIYSDPKRHRFYSCYQAYKDEGLKGIKGGKIKGKKNICFHCGMKKKGHAESTEQL